MYPVQPRKVQIDYAQEPQAVWFMDSAVKSHLLNGYSVIFPAMEDYMGARLKEGAALLDDSWLKQQAVGFASQEATHRAQHLACLEILRRDGYRVDGLLWLLDRATFRVIQPLALRVAEPLFGPTLKLSIVAGSEHWTSAVSRRMLTLDDGMDADTPMKRLFYWHGAEELEHSAVAFDVFEAAGGGYPMRILGFLMGTPVFIAWSLLAVAVLLAQTPGRRIWRWGTVRELVELLFTREAFVLLLIRQFLGYLRPGFHPHQQDNLPLIARGLAAVDLRPRLEVP